MRESLCKCANPSNVSQSSKPLILILLLFHDAEPTEDGAEVMSSEMLSDAVMVASSILSARAGQAEPRSVKLAGALAQLSGQRSTIVVRLALCPLPRCLPFPARVNVCCRKMRESERKEQPQFGSQPKACCPARTHG